MSEKWYNKINKGGIFMKVSIRGKNIALTEGIETKINKKLSMLDKYFIMSDNVEAKVLIRTYPVGQKIEVTIPTEYVLLRAEVVDNDLYNAIDLVIDKLEGQIRKYKTRLSRKSKDNKLELNVASIEPLDHEEEDVIVKTKSISPKPMDMEDDELILHKFGQKLQQLRKNQSLTLQELEAIVDIDNSNLSKYESGSIDIRLTSLDKLSKALGITLSKLFEGIE